MDGVVYLIKKQRVKDSIGQYVDAEEIRTEILTEINSINRTEFSAAGRNGFNPDIFFKTPLINYNGEDEVEYNGIRYGIYRTYIPANDSDFIELYAQKKAGVQ